MATGCQEMCMNLSGFRVVYMLVGSGFFNGVLI